MENVNCCIITLDSDIDLEPESECNEQAFSLSRHIVRFFCLDLGLTYIQVTLTLIFDLISLQLLACKILDKHKFHVLEINEGYETYIMKKEQAAEVSLLPWNLDFINFFFRHFFCHIAANS